MDGLMNLSISLHSQCKTWALLFTVVGFYSSCQFLSVFKQAYKLVGALVSTVRELTQSLLRHLLM